MLDNEDTIVAVSSAAGAAARMIVRLDGPAAHRIAGGLCEELPEAGAARWSQLALGERAVLAWVYMFARPRSYTGNDLVELHVPGNPLLAQWLLRVTQAAGARSAQPGEFTARAYFNGRLDLTAAEGVAATIGSQSERELRAARQLMAGELARRLAPAADLLAQTLALVEVGIDFSDEDVTVLPEAELRGRIGRAGAMLTELVRDSARFERLAHEPRIVLTGRPNAGKSTLLNALAGMQRAVVSPVAGTTRDLLSAQVLLQRGMVLMIDAAGLEDDGPAGGDGGLAHVQRQMRTRALQAAEEADVLVLLRETGDKRQAPALPRPPDLEVQSKADLSGARAGGVLAISAVTGENLDVLRHRLDELAFGPAAGGEAALALNSRHRHCINQVQQALQRAQQRAGEGAELVALELREAADAVGDILGRNTPDDLLGRIFSTFCIGK